MKAKEKYYYIKKLNIPIYNEPVSHVRQDELNKILDKHKIKELFSKYYGIQTGLLRDNGIHGLYCWDCELVFKQIFEKYKPTIEEWD
jgi:hypothetical protein